MTATTATTIAKVGGAPPDLRLGPATNGLLGDAFTLPTAPSGAPTLRRDFFGVMVVDLKPFLIGSRPADEQPNAPSGQPWYTALWQTIADDPHAAPVPPPAPGPPPPPPQPPGG